MSVDVPSDGQRSNNSKDISRNSNEIWTLMMRVGIPNKQPAWSHLWRERIFSIFRYAGAMLCLRLSTQHSWNTSMSMSLYTPSWRVKDTYPVRYVLHLRWSLSTCLNGKGGAAGAVEGESPIYGCPKSSLCSWLFSDDERGLCGSAASVIMVYLYIYQLKGKIFQIRFLTDAKVPVLCQSESALV